MGVGGDRVHPAEQGEGGRHDGLRAGTAGGMAATEGPPPARRASGTAPHEWMRESTKGTVRVGHPLLGSPPYLVFALLSRQGEARTAAKVDAAFPGLHAERGDWQGDWPTHTQKGGCPLPVCHHCHNWAHSATRGQGTGTTHMRLTTRAIRCAAPPGGAGEPPALCSHKHPHPTQHPHPPTRTCLHPPGVAADAPPPTHTHRGRSRRCRCPPGAALPTAWLSTLPPPTTPAPPSVGARTFARTTGQGAAGRAEAGMSEGHPRRVACAPLCGLSRTLGHGCARRSWAWLCAQVRARGARGGGSRGPTAPALTLLLQPGDLVGEPGEAGVG